MGIIMALLGVALVVLGIVLENDPSDDEPGVPGETERIIENIPDEEPPLPEFLWKKKWFRADRDISCEEKLTFTEEGEFVYFCSCGSPVDHYDIYWEYTYREKDRIITLLGDEGDSEEMKVLFYDSYGLVLRLESGEVRTFKSGSAPDFEAEPEIAREFISDTVFSACVAEYKDGVITLLPSDYNTDEIEMFEGMVFEFNVLPDAKVLSVYVTIDNGEVSMEKEELDWDSAFITEDNSRPYVLVALDGEGNITKSVMYGTTEIWG